jgi:precorrin-2 dehydrogenase / sirohydrochlorin ferrochelatase
MGDKPHYVAVIDLDDRSVLVVGAGRVAHEKARGLLDCGAAVTVVAPRVSPEVAALPVELLRRPYRRSDLDGRYLVVAATSDRAVNTRVFADAEARALLCNVVDVPELCSFILPALHREDPITVAVSTGGASPVLAQRLRDEIAKVVRPEHAALAVRLRERRPWAKAHLPTYEARRDYFAGLVREELG